MKPMTWTKPRSGSLCLSFCRLAGTLLAVYALMGCTSMVKPIKDGIVSGQNASGEHSWTPAEQAHWTPVRFPGKRHTTFKLVDHGQRAGMQADAAKSASMQRHTLHVPPEQLGALKFAWQVPAGWLGCPLQAPPCGWCWLLKGTDANSLPAMPCSANSRTP